MGWAGGRRAGEGRGGTAYYPAGHVPICGCSAAAAVAVEAVKAGGRGRLRVVHVHISRRRTNTPHSCLTAVIYPSSSGRFSTFCPSHMIEWVRPRNK